MAALASIASHRRRPQRGFKVLALCLLGAAVALLSLSGALLFTGAEHLRCRRPRAAAVLGGGRQVEMVSRRAGLAVLDSDDHRVVVIKANGDRDLFKVPQSVECTNGWDLTFLALGKGGIEAENFGGFGHVVKSILGDEPPDNGKWFWSLYVYNRGRWVRQKDAVDTVNIDEYPHIAWIAQKTGVTRQEEEERIMGLLETEPSA
mmetsp:Transcript_42357/g.76879  ORF Transcript_42357/g.76879 Transcript_42357/m.76879 type:complete len:204 (-) Transcript_42357:55-666(-)